MNNNRSESISALVTSLAIAQGEFKAATKSRRNPFLKNMYATLDDIIAAIREPLSKNGLSFMQPVMHDGEGFVLETIVFHESGEWYSSKSPIPHFAGKGINELQALGGALTYMRRYMLSSMLGINAEEDGDGNGKAERDKGGNGKAEKGTQKPQKEEAQGHWIDGKTKGGKEVKAAFWAWTNERKLTASEVYETLGVEGIHGYSGTMGDAKMALDQYIKDRGEDPILAPIDTKIAELAEDAA